MRRTLLTLGAVSLTAMAFAASAALALYDGFFSCDVYVGEGCRSPNSQTYYENFVSIDTNTKVSARINRVSDLAQRAYCISFGSCTALADQVISSQMWAYIFRNTGDGGRHYIQSRTNW